MIRAEHLRKSFGTVRAVEDVSFEIRRGETFGLLGPNGAGKSTTINMLVGAIRCDAGRVTIDGEDDPTRATVRRRVGVAPQKLSLYDDLTGEENLRFFGSLYGLDGATLRERIDRGISLAGLEEKRHKRVKTYSGGMQRRLNLAVALVHNPMVLLLDEPTVGVDPQSRNHLFESIEGLKKDGVTILYTTHYMEEAQRLCDRVAIMDQGRMLDVDAVPALIQRHGGRAVVRAELERRPDDGQHLPGTLDGTRLCFESDRPFEDLAGLSAGGVAFGHVAVDRPDLESVFLSLTGRRLRDE